MKSFGGCNAALSNTSTLMLSATSALVQRIARVDVTSPLATPSGKDTAPAVAGTAHAKTRPSIAGVHSRLTFPLNLPNRQRPPFGDLLVIPADSNMTPESCKQFQDSYYTLGLVEGQSRSRGLCSVGFAARASMVVSLAAVALGLPTVAAANHSLTDLVSTGP